MIGHGEEDYVLKEGDVSVLDMPGILVGISYKQCCMKPLTGREESMVMWFILLSMDLPLSV